jgi:hypothetical protein
MTTTKTHAVTLAATGLAVAAALAGCSASPGSSTPSATPTDSMTVSAETAAFCTSLGEIQTAVVAPTPDPKQIESLLTTIQDTAPQELATDIPVVSAAARNPSEQPGADFYPAMTKMATWVGENCDAQVITAAVSADGKLVDVPATAKAGLTVITASSADGSASVGIMRRAEGATQSPSELLQMSDKEIQGKLSYVSSGNPSGVAELTPGNYVFVAFSTNGPPTDAVDLTVQ